MLSWIRALFAPPSIGYDDSVRLDAASKDALLLGLNRVLPDHRAWVTLDEARGLFSTADKDYAFGETDETGKQNIEAFATLSNSQVEFMPAENRVYFLSDNPSGGKRRRGAATAAVRS